MPAAPLVLINVPVPPNPQPGLPNVQPAIPIAQPALKNLNTVYYNPKITEFGQFACVICMSE